MTTSESTSPKGREYDSASGSTEYGQLWENTKIGSKKRVAFYLATQVREGGFFTIDDMRDTIRTADGKGIDEIDRRIRELREVGWIIRNYKTLATLAPNELFLETVGDRVWEKDYKTPRSTTLSASARAAVYARDGKRCAVCGIDFGDEYADLAALGLHTKARPTIGHWTPRERGGSDDLTNLRPECHLCNEQARNLTLTPVDVALLKRQIAELKRDDKRKLSSWLLTSRRTFTELERVWSEINKLPTNDRDDIKQYVADMLGDS